MWFGSLLSFYNVLIPRVLWLGTMWLGSYLLLTSVCEQVCTESDWNLVWMYTVFHGHGHVGDPNASDPWEMAKSSSGPCAEGGSVWQHVYLSFLLLVFTAWRLLPYRLLQPRLAKAVSLFNCIWKLCFHVYLYVTAPPPCSTVYNNLASVCICI